MAMMKSTMAPAWDRARSSTSPRTAVPAGRTRMAKKRPMPAPAWNTTAAQFTGANNAPGVTPALAPMPMPMQTQRNPYTVAPAWFTGQNNAPGIMQTGPNQRMVFRAPGGNIVRMAPNSIYGMPQVRPPSIWDILLGRNSMYTQPASGVSGVRG